MTQTQAARVCIRLPCEFPAEIKFLGGGTEHIKKALISNISTTGIQILSPSFIATGQTVQASFKIPGQNSRTTLRAEVMRVESLLGRMVGHYPYALGAKFISAEKNQENQIIGFIADKTTCAPQRTVMSLFLFFLGALEIVQIFKPFVDLDLGLMVSSSQQVLVGWLNLTVSSVLAMGLIGASLLCFFNRKSFIRLGIFFLCAEIITTVIIQLPLDGLFSGLTQNKLLWLIDCTLIATSGLLIWSILKTAEQLKQIELRLTAEKISPGAGKPTFTIL